MEQENQNVVDITVPMRVKRTVKHSVLFEATTPEGAAIVPTCYIRKPIGESLGQEFEMILRKTK